MTRILLVEGDPVQADSIGASLRHSGWEVTRAGTILEAIRAAGDHSFDAAVLDTELPDGSGLDILDFLRIGSPNIRIMLLLETSDESVAFHALSHGAGDLLVKDAHLDSELPRRLESMLDQVDPMSALVSTLLPVKHYEVRDTRRARTEPLPPLDAVMSRILRSDAIAAGVFDIRGRPLATKAREGLDPDGVGFALATLHGQVGALWSYGDLKPTGYRMLIDVEGGTLAVTAIPGTFIVALLLPARSGPQDVMEALDGASRAILEALQKHARDE